MIALLVCMPTAALLASAALALLVSHLRCRVQRALNRRFHGDRISTRPEVAVAARYDRQQVSSDALPLGSVSAGRLPAWQKGSCGRWLSRPGEG